MQVVYERCCGIDVHKQTVVACVIVPGPDGQPLKETRTFATMIAHLEALADWLAGLVSAMWRWRARGCTGSPYTTCWMTGSPSWWSTPNASKRGA